MIHLKTVALHQLHSFNAEVPFLELACDSRSEIANVHYRREASGRGVKQNAETSNVPWKEKTRKQRRARSNSFVSESGGNNLNYLAIMAAY